MIQTLKTRRFCSHQAIDNIIMITVVTLTGRERRDPVGDRAVGRADAATTTSDDACRSGDFPVILGRG